MTARTFIYCICCFMLYSAAVIAQQPAGEVLNYEQRTVAYYAGKQWDSLLITGEEAVHAGYEYYYIRIRTGEAAYHLGRYGRAAGHLQKALQHNTTPYATEVLFYSLLFGGRSEQAARLTGRGGTQAVQLRRQNLRPVIYAEGGPLTSTTMQQRIPVLADTGIYRDAVTEQGAMYYTVGGTGFIGSRIHLHANLSLLSYRKHRETHIAYLDTLSGDFRVHQVSGYLSAGLSLPGNLVITPALHYARVNLTEPLTTPDTLIQKYLGPPLGGTLTDYAAGAELTYAGAYVRLTAGAWHLRYSGTGRLQASASCTWLPWGNLNFYTTTGVTYKAGTERRPLVITQLVGFRIAKRLWAEASVAAGDLAGTAEQNALLLNNQVTGTRYRVSGLVIWSLLPGIKALARYQYTAAEASAAYMGESLVLQTQPYTYDKHLITIGITCTLPSQY